MNDFNAPIHSSILLEVAQENLRQNELWGSDRHIPNGTGEEFRSLADAARAECKAAKENTTWRHILYEEVMEAFAESESPLLREELVQVAAVCAAWIADIDSQSAVKSSTI